MYLQSFDCLRKTVQYEGFMGLYRGLLPPLLAVGPEKAIKFAVNDLLRGLATSQEQDQHWFLEIVSGGCAGACQLLVTNPLELIKIRMQMHGETARLYELKGLPKPKAKSFSQVAADLGMSGLYRGAAACLLRDIPFGAIYFPAYAACKDYLVNREGGPGSASASTILIAGTMAGIPASFFTTPADMVKTRLQVLPRQGEMVYSGIGDCFKKVYQTEGPTAFFKGSLFRVGRIAPQFGISLLCYEYLTQSIGMPASLPPTNAPIDPRDYKMAFPTQAIGTKTDDIHNLVQNMGFQSRAFKASTPVGKTDPKR
jgi:solute carrier family 25 aspartate/glutamate transporter 12/13